jgi:hypoxanthine phosphoribosyltransferase
MTIPDHLELLYDSAAIENTLVKLGTEMDKWAAGAEARTGKMLLAVCVLRGGVFFFSDLLLQMKFSVEPAFCRAYAYAKTKNGEPLDKMFCDWQGLDPVGREVMLVDNICDSHRKVIPSIAQSKYKSCCIGRIDQF